MGGCETLSLALVADGVFSLVTAALKAEPCLQTPSDIARCLVRIPSPGHPKPRCITRKLSPLYAKNGMEFKIEGIDTATCWKP